VVAPKPTSGPLPLEGRAGEGVGSGYTAHPFAVTLDRMPTLAERFPRRAASWRLRTRTLTFGKRPLIMGIVNVTPDSFSDGGAFIDPDAAVRSALRMVEQGADLIDVGGESTRPGSDRVGVSEQLRLVIPVIERLVGCLPAGFPISVDTTRSAVAQAALASGAVFINDVSAGRDDPDMLNLAADTGVPIALMHMLGQPKTMQDAPRYGDVVDEVLAFLLERAETAQQGGVAREQIVIDPGIGFGKRKDDNLRLMANLGRFVATDYPVLLGTSRKRFMGAVCGQTEPKDLVSATVATTALGVLAGVRLFRVHDVAENRQAADVARAIRDSRE
jgi:dihydropteroate synthase